MIKVALTIALLTLAACDDAIMAPADSQPSATAPMQAKAGEWACTPAIDLDSAWMRTCTMDSLIRVDYAWSQSYGERHPEWVRGNGGGGIVYIIKGADTLSAKTW